MEAELVWKTSLPIDTARKIDRLPRAIVELAGLLDRYAYRPIKAQCSEYIGRLTAIKPEGSGAAKGRNRRERIRCEDGVVSAVKPANALIGPEVKAGTDINDSRFVIDLFCGGIPLSEHGTQSGLRD